MRNAILSIVIILLSCTLYGQDRSSVQDIVNSINRDSLLSYVKRLEAFGTRDEFTLQRDSAAEYILSAFSRAGLQSASDWYTFGTTRLRDAAIHTKDSLWVVGEDGAMASSSNGGVTWDVQETPAGSANLYGIAMMPEGLGFAVGASGTILSTTDAGAHWSLVAPVTSSFLLSVNFASPTTGLIVGLDGTILRTTTAGATWENVGADTLGVLRTVQFISPTTAIIGGDAGSILRSTDAGKTWILYPDVVSSLTSIHFPDSLNGFACGAGSLARTIDGGLTWSWITTLPSESSPQSVFFIDSLHGCVVGRYTEIFLTTDGGKNWQEVDGMDGTPWGPYFDMIRGIPGDRMVVVGSRSHILTSTNSGATWANCSNSLPYPLFRESRNVVATIRGVITPEIECVLLAHYDSYSNVPGKAPGANDNATGTAAVMEAARICSQYRFASSIKFLAVSAEEMGMYGSEHYVGTIKKENRIIKGAVNADMIGYPLHYDTLRLLAGSFEQRNWLVDSAVVYNQRYGIGLHLVDGIDNTGASDYGSFARAGYDALELAEGTPEEIWGGADPYYHSLNDLSAKLNFGLVRRAAQLMVAVGAELAGVLGTTGIEYAGNEQPKEFLLHQNYPNPFNPATTIAYQLPKNAMVTLRIYDMLGREVQTLVDGYKTAGYYAAAFNAGDLASGVYLYRLVSHPTEGGTKDLFTAAKKMVLVK